MWLAAKDVVNEKPVKQEKKKPAKPKKPKAQQSESSQPVTSVIADAAPKSAVATVPGIPSVKPKRKKPGTAVKHKVQPIAVDPKGKRKGFVSESFRRCYMTRGRRLPRSEFTPVPSHGAIIVYMIPPQNEMLARVTPA